MDRRQPRVALLGGGSWATTVASIVARGAPTVLWARSPEVAEEVDRRGRNSRYLGDFPLTDGLRATDSLEQAVQDADVVVMGVPSHGFRGVLEQVVSHVRPWIPVVSLVKGLEQVTDHRMTEIVAEVLPGHPAGVLAGPNIAKEVMAGYAAAATIAMPDQNLAARLADLFRTSRFRIYSTTDVVGVVITRAVREMRRLGEALGGYPLTFSGLAGTGDLIVTCTSPLSRNRHVGEELGRGKPIGEVLAGMKQVAEGVKAAPVVVKLAAEAGVDMPIVREVDAVLTHGATVQDAYRGLLRVAPGHELHGEGW